MHLGEKIKVFRELKNISQKGLANVLGISQQAYSYLEKNGLDSSDKKFDIIANALSIKKEVIESFDEQKIFQQNYYNHAIENNTNNCNNCAFQQNGQELILILKEMLLELKEKNK
ncbi:MAG: helix-turn-helix transcriptional regulator [Bacteroidetes bacterium]|nr:helix-turn-helix transcriptional regulator [Bacteroidota bacterium]